MPARRNAAALPAPTANQAWPGRLRNGCRRAAARTAAGLVTSTRGAASAARRESRVAASSRSRNAHGDSAISPPPRRAAARRNASCPPRGRSEITYHATASTGTAAGGVGGRRADIAAASHSRRARRLYCPRIRPTASA